MSAAKRRGRGWMLGVLGVAVAGTLAGYGIWSRGATVTSLQRDADDEAVPRVQLISPKPGPAQIVQTLPGNVAAWNEAPIYAQVSGYVTHWDKDYGARVKKDEVLAEIEAPGLHAQYEASKAQLETAVENYNLAQVTANRYSQLQGSPAVSEQQVDNYVSAAATAKAQVAVAQENMKRFYAMIGFEKVVAPFDGVVTARRVNIGDYVNSAGGDASVQGAATPLFSVADISKLRVFVDVPQALGNVLSTALTATLTLPNDPKKVIKADFLTQSGAVSPNTRTIVTELVVNDGQALFPGSYVDVHLTTPAASSTLVVPSQALLFRAEGMQVATVSPDNHVHLQSVTLGNNLGLTVQIVSGLTASDKIVANPSLGLLEGQEVKPVQAAAGYEPGEGPKPK